MLCALLLMGGVWVANRCDSSDKATASTTTEAVSSTSESADISVESESAQTSSAVYTSTSSAAVDKLCEVTVPSSMKKSGQRLSRAGYTLLYNKEWRLPVWVGWHLTSSHTDGSYGRKGIKFAEDEDVPTPRATNSDYVNSGYDRGHICPSGDNKWSEQAQQQSFLYTNCCPQLHNLNAGDWKELEEQCRTWAQKYGDIYIVAGPLLLNKQHKTIGRNKVIVPEAFFKVVLCMSGTPKAIGFIYRNEVTNKKMSSYVNSVDEVERITGYDFFAALPDDVEKKVEKAADLGEW